MFGVVKENFFIFRGGGNDITWPGEANNQKPATIQLFSRSGDSDFTLHIIQSMTHYLP